MSRRLWVGAAIVLIGLGMAGGVVVLAGEGLDRAEKWVSITGVALSVALSGAGLGLAWRQRRSSTPPTRAHHTGTATAHGPGSQANSGLLGPAAPAGSAVAEHTGDAGATDGGVANSGIDSSSPLS